MTLRTRCRSSIARSAAGPRPIAANPMSHRYFRYRDGRLHASGVPLDALAAEVGTPFYCYDAHAPEHGYRNFPAALADLPAPICYALICRDARMDAVGTSVKTL